MLTLGAATSIRPRAAVFLTLLSLSAIASPARAQSTTQDSDPQPTGSARIAGRVLASDDGRPVRRAVVRLSGRAAGTQTSDPKHGYLQREVQTDDDGGFGFVGLPAGSYAINVGRPNGFVELARAQQVTVHEGRSVEVPIRLERTGAIVGRIADRNGEGLLGIEVIALRRSEFRGRVTLMPDYGSRGSTNDLGQFRLFNLSPGEYFVVAAPVVVRPPADSPRALSTTRLTGFVKTYYPGSQEVGDARLIVVRSGKDVTNVDFSLASGPLASVAIDALDSHGQPLGREAYATLNLEGDVYLSSSMRQTNRADGGQFVFREVPPADYYLIVNTSYRQEESAYLKVKVDGDVALQVQTNAGAKVSGRFVVQGTPRGTNTGQPMSNVAITATPPPGRTGPSYARDALIHPQGTDRFELTGLRGPMVLHAQMPGALLASISRAGGENLAGKPLEFTGTERIDDLLVVFTHEKANAEVTLTGLREPDDPEKVLVILFSEDSTRWHAGSLQYTVIEASAEMRRQTAAAGAGRPGRVFTFPLGPVVPGRYLVAAVPNPGVMSPTEPDILERLRPLAVPVTLVAGETVKVEVGVSR
jgi:Carboxypeptidase regulatory-like domain